MSVRIHLIQPSCIDGVVNVRDGGRAQNRDNDDVSTLVNQFGFFDPAAGFQFNTTGHLASFELKAANSSCRLNMEIDIVAKGNSNC